MKRCCCSCGREVVPALFTSGDTLRTPFLFGHVLMTEREALLILTRSARQSFLATPLLAPPVKQRRAGTCGVR